MPHQRYKMAMNTPRRHQLPGKHRQMLVLRSMLINKLIYVPTSCRPGALRRITKATGNSASPGTEQNIAAESFSGTIEVVCCHHIRYIYKCVQEKSIM